VGSAEILHKAHYVIRGLDELNIEKLELIENSIML
jgi:hypothetical protein